MSHYYWWIVRDSPGFCSTLHLQKSSSEVAALGTDPLILVQEKRMLMLAFNEPATSVVVALFLFLFYLMNWLNKIVRQCVSTFFCNQSGEWQIALWWFKWTPSTTRWYTRVLKRFSYFKCGGFYLGALKRRGNKEHWADRYRVTSSRKKLTLWYSAVYFLWQYYRWKSQFQ